MKNLNEVIYRAALEIINGGGSGGASALGAPSDPAWSGIGDGSIISILKAMFQQNIEIEMYLNEISTNTAAT